MNNPASKVATVHQWSFVRFISFWTHVRPGQGFVFTPVCLAIGIGSYFSLNWEPSGAAIVTASLAAATACIIAFIGPRQASPCFWVFSLLCLGFALAAVRTHSVAAPVLVKRYYGPIEGRYVGLDRSASGHLRITLDQVILAGMAPRDTPAKVRIALINVDTPPTEAATRLALTAHLAPPPGPVEPGGFDFRRHAWFQSIGGSGYTHTPVLVASFHEGRSPATILFQMRRKLARHIADAIPSQQAGAMAAALMTGDRSALMPAEIEVLRRTNLAHLLAISGLHMGLLAGFVFAMTRLLLVVIPRVALYWPVKRIAAATALICASAYLVVSGASVATERAFIMTCVALTAILLDRRALTLRSVAIAALLVLLMRPEALLGPGFQMSFAATTALVVAFEGLRPFAEYMREKRSVGWLRPIVRIFLSSLIAGGATAPFAAAHFNRFTTYGLLTNLAVVPLMGAIIMPAAVVAACLMPFGAEAIPLWVMQLGLRWIFVAAGFVAAQPVAIQGVVSPPEWTLVLITAGGIGLAITRGTARLCAATLLAGALLYWPLMAQRPQVLVAADGRLVGVMTPAGRALSHPRRATFTARSWLENDGSLASQADAYKLWPRSSEGGIQPVYPPADTLSQHPLPCTESTLVVAKAPILIDGPCIVLDPTVLAKTGAVAGYSVNGQIRLISANTVTGNRLWAPSASVPRLHPVQAIRLVD